MSIEHEEYQPDQPSHHRRRHSRAEEPPLGLREQFGIPIEFTEEVMSPESANRIAELTEFWTVFDKLYLASGGDISEFASLSSLPVPEIFESYMSVLTKVREKEKAGSQFYCYHRFAPHIKKSSLDMTLSPLERSTTVGDVIISNRNLYLILDRETHTYINPGEKPVSRDAYDLTHMSMLVPRTRVDKGGKNFSSGGEAAGDSVIHIEYGDMSVDAVFDAITDNNLEMKDTDFISSRAVSSTFIELLPEFLKTHAIEALTEEYIKEFMLTVHEAVKTKHADGMEIRATGVVSFHCGGKIIIARWGDCEFSFCTPIDGEIHAFIPPLNTTSVFDDPSVRDTQLPNLAIPEASREFYQQNYPVYLDGSYPRKFNCDGGIGSIGTAGDFASKVEMYTIQIPKGSKYSLVLYSDGVMEYGDRIGIEQPWVFSLFVQSLSAQSEFASSTTTLERSMDQINALSFALQSHPNFKHHRDMLQEKGIAYTDEFLAFIDPFIASRFPYAVIASTILTRMMSGIDHPRHQDRGKLDDLGVTICNSGWLPEFASVKSLAIERARLMSQKNTILQEDIARVLQHMTDLIKDGIPQ